MSTINNKINVHVKTTDREIPSQYAEAAAFAYLAFLKKGKLFNQSTVKDSPQPHVVFAFGFFITNFEPDKSST